jgi:TatD DNase family protein
MWFDTHCHLDSDNAEGGAEAIISRAEQAGVGYFTCIGVGGSRAMRQAVELAARHPVVWASVGVHPHDAQSLDAALEAELLELIESPRVVALGEVGLDYHYEHSPRAVQREVFARMIAVAREHRKPIIVHTRSAPGETLELLASESARDVGGIIHCFSEDRPFASKALDLGFDLSFSGIVTFKSARAVQDVAAWAPVDRVLVETDSPYLAPVPLRGRRCEPAYLVHTAARVAALRGTQVSDLCAQTTRNAARRFGLDLED